MADYIDRQDAIIALRKLSDRYYKMIVSPTVLAEKEFEAIPSADVAPVVRCKDCRHRNGDYCHNNDGFAHFDHFFVQDDDYCSRGERMDGEEE